MKKLVILICLGIVYGTSATVRYGQLTGTNVVVVSEGELFSLMANNFLSSGGLRISTEEPSNTYDIEFGYAYGSSWGAAVSVPILDAGTIVGPCSVQLVYESNFCSYKITRPDLTASVSPMNIISLPYDNNGDIDLLVETSTDLQTWTPVYSGSAGTSNSAAFFRTRLITQ